MVTASCFAPPRGIGNPRISYSDAEGRFAFADLPSDPDYSCFLYSVERDGYVTKTGIPPETDAIRLTPEAVISGKVLNETGEGISGLSIALEARDGISDNGIPNIGEKFYRTGPGGLFRLDKLPAGRYFVCAIPDINAPRKDERTYYPLTCSSPDREKPEWIALKAGESRNLEFQIIPRSGVIVSGKVTNPEPGMGFSILSTSHGFLANYGFVGVAEKWNWNSGEFEHRNLPPGEYYVEAISEDGKRNAVKTVTVGSEDIRDLQFTLKPLPVLAGRFHTDNGSALPSLENHRGLTLDFEGRSLTTIEISKDGSFRTELRLPLRYQLNTFGAAAVDSSGWWNIKSARQTDRDVLVDDIVVRAEDPAPIDITLTRENGSLEATVKAESDIERTTIFTLAMRRFGSRLRWVDNAGGGIRLDKIPPGDYLLFARSSRCALRYADPEFLDTYKRYRTDALVQNGRLTKVEIQPIPCAPSEP